MRGLALLMARRYLFSRKSHSIINIISCVSAFAVAIPVAAMVILLSVFNGLEQLVKGLYDNFDPDIMVTVVQGKVFDSTAVNRVSLLELADVAQVSMMLEDQALLEYRGRQIIATLRGVDSLYTQINPVDKMITSGEYKLHFGDMQQAVVGQGVANNLGIRTSLYDPIIAYTPRRGAYNPLLPMVNYNSRRIFPSGVFMLEAETDSKYVIVPLEFTQELFDYTGHYSAAMIRLREGADPRVVQSAIAEMLGGEFRVQTRYDLRQNYYRIMLYEKWGIFFISLLVLVIASFSIIGSLVMLIIEKRGNIATLRAMGGNTRFIRGIFVREGMLISMAGALGGLTLGLLFCWVQIRFGVIQIPASTLLVDSYPVVVKLSDIVGIVATFTLTTYIISKVTVVKMISKHNSLTQEL